jgi:acetylornithine deacetylase/succinyl-diaminopimelate desuccinylase-like protein
MKRAFDYVDTHMGEMIDDLKEICSRPSVAGSEKGLEAARRTILSKMKSLGLKAERHDVPEGNALLSACWGDGVAPLLFYNHYDVVEPGKYENWRTNDPFRLEEQDGRLYGRGVSDNKGPLYSRLHATQAILATDGGLPVPVKFIAEGDEETSSTSMYRFARTNPELFKELIRADVCVWENGRNDTAGHTWLRMGVRGGTAFDLRVTTSKTDVHGSMGSAVPSASWHMIQALSTLKTPDERIAIDGFYDRVQQTSEADLEVLRAFPYEEEAVKKKIGFWQFVNGATGEKLKQQIYLQPTISVCAIEAGEPHNGVRGIVPHTAYARISFYLVADQDPDELEGMLRRHFEKHGFGDIEITARDRYGAMNRPVRTPVDIPFRNRAQEAAKSVFEQPMIIELTQLGAGPAGIFREAWPDLPIVGFGPGGTEGNHHAPDENIKIEDYRNAVKYVIALLYSYMDEQK